jgi:polyvinyl alcohol dehydrogenase (cytochrome)
MNRFSPLTVLVLPLAFLCSAESARADWWPEFGRDQINSFSTAETWVDLTQASRLEEKWIASTGNGVSSCPIVVRDTVYFGTIGGQVEAVWLASGAPLWNTQLDGPLFGTPLFRQGRLYVGDYLCNAYCLSATTGEILWKTSCGDPLYESFQGSASLAAGRILLGVANSTGDDPCVRGRLVALNAQTGSIAWTYYAVNDTSTGGGMWGTPSVDPETGYVYVVDGNPCTGDPGRDTDAILCLDAHTGAKIWSWQAHYGDTYDFDFGSTPCLFDTQAATLVQGAAAGSKDGWLYAVNRATGRLLWKTQLAQPTGLGGDIGIISSAAFWNTTLIVGTGITLDGHPGSICGVNAVDGTLLWRYNMPGPVYGPVSVANGVAFGASLAANLVALNVATGDSLWGTQVDNGPIFGGPTISHGYILIGSFNYKVHAYSLPTVPTGVSVGDEPDGVWAFTSTLRAFRDNRGRTRFAATGVQLDAARVEIFDVTGRRIHDLLLHCTADGAEATWDGRTSNGASMPAGVYLARLAGTSVSTHVLLLAP